MNTKFLELLEYDSLIDIIEKYCKTYVGKEKASCLLPSFNKETAKYLLKQTDEAVRIKVKKSSPPICEIPDISVCLKMLDSSAILPLKGLLELTKVLQISRELKEYFRDDDENFLSFPILANYFSDLYINKGIEDRIFSVILDENTISDSASAKLESIRKEIKKIEQNIREKLNNFIHSTTYSKFIMEPIITIRNSRFVIPIKEEYKNNVKGFVHDISSSGSSVFIEPISIFELNNQITNLKIEEEIEIEKILQILSGLFYEYSNQLKQNVDIIGTLDLIFAKASYSLDTNGTIPTINNSKFIDLKRARHPLIDKSIVVPIDISIGNEYSSLIITGPNTGGKTVTLKTVGLILLMAYSGLLIPCNENSSIYIFDNIFVDIGDKQSIQESLSTFSAHISTIVDILKNFTPSSLILLDELGSGTDPIEGASLAISILKYLHDRKATTISTTHYQELKNFCMVTEGFENASCEFDVENLKPTYKLLIGIPGKSNAFAISKKLGINEEILNYASSIINEQDISIEELMKNIYDDKIAIEKEKKLIEENSMQISTLKNELENKLSASKHKEQEIIEKAKKEAKEIILSAKDEVSSIIQEINEMSKDSSNLKRANQLRNNLNNMLKETNFSTNSGLNLEVLKSLNSKEQMKNSKPHSSEFSKVSFSKNSKYKSQNVSTEINVIGLNVDEATFLIDKYIDDCAIAKLSPIRIVHGKGTGKLRQGIHTFLKSNPHVKSFRLGTFGEGEMGVTVVDLKL